MDELHIPVTVLGACISNVGGRAYFGAVIVGSSVYRPYDAFKTTSDAGGHLFFLSSIYVEDGALLVDCYKILERPPAVIPTTELATLSPVCFSHLVRICLFPDKRVAASLIGDDVPEYPGHSVFFKDKNETFDISVAVFLDATPHPALEAVRRAVKKTIGTAPPVQTQPPGPSEMFTFLLPMDPTVRAPTPIKRDPVEQVCTEEEEEEEEGEAELDSIETTLPEPKRSRRANEKVFPTLEECNKSLLLGREEMFRILSRKGPGFPDIKGRLALLTFDRRGDDPVVDLVTLVSFVGKSYKPYEFRNEAGAVVRGLTHGIRLVRSVGAIEERRLDSIVHDKDIAKYGGISRPLYDEWVRLTTKHSRGKYQMYPK